MGPIDCRCSLQGLPLCRHTNLGYQRGGDARTGRMRLIIYVLLYMNIINMEDCLI